MGTSQVLFVAIYRTSNLALKLASKIPVEVSTARAELMLLDQDLDSGHCNKARNGYDSDTRDLHDIITTELYRLACRIHIRKLLGSSSPEEDLTIYRLVEDFVNELQFLPPNSPSHSILSWPLVVAGFAARNANHQRIIVARLAQIHDEWQSDVFSKSAAYLQEKWKGDKFPKQGILDTSNFRGSSGIRTPWNNCPVLLAWHCLVQQKLIACSDTKFLYMNRTQDSRVWLLFSSTRSSRRCCHDYTEQPADFIRIPTLLCNGFDPQARLLRSQTG